MKQNKKMPTTEPKNTLTQDDEKNAASRLSESIENGAPTPSIDMILENKILHELLQTFYARHSSCFREGDAGKKAREAHRQFFNGAGCAILALSNIEKRLLTPSFFKTLTESLLWEGERFVK